MKIVLATLNARYSHASLGLRYLFANLGDLQKAAEICEFTISQDSGAIVQSLLAKDPGILAFGVYIWNTRQTEEVLRRLRVVRPDLTIILGGPEVSYETLEQSITQLANHVIQGEGDHAFRLLCQALLRGEKPPATIHPETPAVESLASPYAFYTDHDIRTRTIYVEASRGCPYTCEFCLSALDNGVRNFPLPAFLQNLNTLLARGCRQFKFIDRTFNLHPEISLAILEFFRQRLDLGLFLHFEMVPDRLPEELKRLIVTFPPGSLQFEIGIQTFDVATAKRISRRQNYARTAENLRFLRRETNVHIHADLIAGLPGEDEETFARGFDQLAQLAPHEIQVGILKRLRGMPLTQHDQAWDMVYDASPPYAVQSTKTMPAATLQRIATFASFWDRLANGGDFPRTMHLLRELAKNSSLYSLFMQLSEDLLRQVGRTHSLDLLDLCRALTHFLVNQTGVPLRQATEAVWLDYAANGLRRIPRAIGLEIPTFPRTPLAATSVPKRQQKHLAIR